LVPSEVLNAIGMGLLREVHPKTTTGMDVIQLSRRR
jgi:hypothetical protein